MKIIYLDSYCKLQFTDEDYNKLETFTLNGKQYKDFQFMNGVYVRIPLELFQEVGD